jgi:hypothetical protein
MSTHADPSKDEYLELEKKLGAAEYELAANLAETDKALGTAVKKGNKRPRRRADSSSGRLPHGRGSTIRKGFGVTPSRPRRGAATLQLCLSLYAASRYCIDERGVVALVLVGVDIGERGDRAIERLGGTKVAGDCEGVAGSRVGAGRFLGLQEQRIARVVSEQEDRPTSRPHAPHADDLAREVDVAKALQQAPAITLQAAGVRLQDPAGAQLQPCRPRAVNEVGDRHDQRRVRRDPRLAGVRHRQLRERPGAVLAAAFGDPLLEPPALAGAPLVSAPALEAR